MPSISRDQVVTALAQTLRSELLEGHEATVPGLGHFSIEHKKSCLQQKDSGTMVLTPPQDTVVFTPAE